MASTPPEANTTGGGASKSAEQLRQLGGAEKRVAIALIVFFLIFMVLLIRFRADPQWDRLVWIAGGIEALVFAGAGALFGTSVQRTQTAEALEERDKTKAERDSAQSKADGAMRGQANGEALAEVVKVKRDLIADQPVEQDASHGRSLMGNRGDALKDQELSQVIEMGALADRLFP